MMALEDGKTSSLEEPLDAMFEFKVPVGDARTAKEALFSLTSSFLFSLFSPLSR